VTFAVREGEAHALVGENGAGKIDAAQDPRRHPPPGQRRAVVERRASVARQPARSARARVLNFLVLPRVGDKKGYEEATSDGSMNRTPETRATLGERAATVSWSFASLTPRQWPTYSHSLKWRLRNTGTGVPCSSSNSAARSMRGPLPTRTTRGASGL
jgi:hypothetical protein